MAIVMLHLQCLPGMSIAKSVDIMSLAASKGKHM